MQDSIIIPFIFYFLSVIGIGVYTTWFSSRGVSEFFPGNHPYRRHRAGLYYPWRIYGSEPDGCAAGLCHAGSPNRFVGIFCYSYGRLERDKK